MAARAQFPSGPGLPGELGLPGVTVFGSPPGPGYLPFSTSNQTAQWYGLGTGLSTSGSQVIATATSNGLGTPPFVGLITGLINVTDKAYGAKGDGVTDDGPAIRAALAGAAPFGTVYLPPGNTYLINSGVKVGDGVTVCGITYPSNGLTIQAYGATIKAGPLLTGDLVCMFPNSVAKPHDSFESATAYNIASGAKPGSTSITLTTPAQASNFTAGDLIYLSVSSGTGNPNQFKGVNIAQSVNVTTGVITLGFPLTRDFTADSGGTIQVADVQSLVTTDLTWFGGTLIMPNAVMFAFSMGESWRTTVRDVSIVGSYQGAASDLVSGIDLLDATFDNIRIRTPCQAAFDLSSRGMNSVKVTHSTVIETGPCSGTALFPLLDTGEATDNITFSDDTVEDNSGYGDISVGSGAVNTAFVDNNIRSTGNPTRPLILTSLGPGLIPVHTRFENNYIELSASAGAQEAVLLSGNDDVFVGNTLNSLSTASGQGIEISVPNTIVANNYISTAPATFGGLVVDTAPNTITGNVITSPTIAPRCITLGNPGSLKSAVLNISNNVLSNCTTVILDTSSGNMPNREIVGNNGVGDTLNNACKGSVTLAAGAGTFTNTCVATSSYCSCRDTTTNANACTAANPAAGSVGITGTGTDVAQVVCQ